jgi:mannose-1-phosphate guanylyltransferase/mannose-6-phosphate isomerase
VIVPVILSGGAGTRLWPASNEWLPKPFLKLPHGETTFAGTVARVADPALFAEPVIVANVAHRAQILTALAEAGAEATLLLEPERRDSAAAIAAAAAFVAARDPDAVMLVLAADHVVRDVAGFRRTIARALPAAEAGAIVIIGIPPTGPATGYGYIRPEPGETRPGLRRVAAFVEKPNAAVAADYVARGYLWNSGNFMMKAATALEELRLRSPQIAEAAEQAVARADEEDGVVLLDAAAFARAPRISFDYAVMEKTDRAEVVTAEFDWSDVGSWAAIWDLAEKDAAGNAALGEVRLHGAEGSFVQAEGLLVGLVGVSDLVVVAGEGVVLVTSRERSDEVKHLVGKLAAEAHPVMAPRGRHPWGAAERIAAGPGFHVERVRVLSGSEVPAATDMRPEHWTVAAGTAEVTLGEAATRLEAGESIDIPPGLSRRFANPGPEPLELIAVRYGE